MLICFFYQKLIVNKEFVPPGQIVNAAFYVEILNRLRGNVRRKRPDHWRNNKWLLHHDNSPAHAALLTRWYLTDKNMSVVPHTPYSPGLTPSDIFLFPKIKMPQKGTTLRVMLAPNVYVKPFCFLSHQSRNLLKLPLVKCLPLFLTRAMKIYFTTCHIAVKKRRWFRQQICPTKVRKYFTLNILFVCQEASNVEGTEFPLCRNFHPFPNSMVSYFILCWNFPDGYVTFLSDKLTVFSFVPFGRGSLQSASKGQILVLVFPAFKIVYLWSVTNNTHAGVSYTHWIRERITSSGNTYFIRNYVAALCRKYVTHQTFVALKHDHVTRNATQ